MKDRRLILGLSFILSLVVVTACQKREAGVDSDAAMREPASQASSTTSTAVASDTAATLPPETPRFEVRLTEFGIDMPATLPAGKLELVVTNGGTKEHNLEVHGEGIENKFAANLKPGEVMPMLLELKGGTYQIYCPLEDHEQKGMAKTVTVAASAGTTTG